MMIPVLIAVSFIVFVLMELTPGSVLDFLIVDGMTAEDIQELREAHNLHRSVIYRYALYMRNLIQGDLGTSDITGVPVFTTFMDRLPNTLILSFSALLIGAVISVAAGIFAARRAGKLADNAMSVLTLVGMSMPPFWAGLMLLLIFSLQLGWFPGGGMRDGIRSLILPAFCSALVIMATTTRLTRSSMLEVLKADYLRTARAKGVPERAVIRQHALRNAWIPVITMLGTGLGNQIAGSVIIETVFSWPGIGRSIVEAVSNRDVPETTGFIIMSSIIFVILQLVVDLLYVFVDPRIKAQYVRSKRMKKSSASEMPALVITPLAVVDAVESSPESIEADDDSLIEQAPIMSIQAETEVREPEQSETHTPVYAAVVSSDSVSASDTVPSMSSATKETEGLVEPDTDKVESYIGTNKKRSQLREIYHHMKKNVGAMVGFYILCAMVLLVIASFFVTLEMVTEPDMANTLSPPTWQNPFGTDRMGRDMFLRVIYGSRYTLAIGFGAAVLAMVIGTPLGAISGFYGGKADHVIMRFSDVLSSIPGLLLGMVIMVVLGIGLGNLIIAVGVPAISIFIRITRASILQIANNEYVEAAKAVGFSSLRILFTQVLPNGLAPVIVTLTMSFGMAIIIGSSLSFLGFGIPVPTPEWGSLVSWGRELARTAPWLMSIPGAFIMVTVLAFNLLGDGLRDALDPKLKRR